MRLLVVFVAVCVAVVAAGPEEDIWLQYNRRMPQGAPTQEESFKGRIIGGVDAYIEDFPYQLSLRRNGFHSCGASVITQHWALSAAHCTYPTPDVEIITLRGGSRYRSEGGHLFDVEEIINHPEYDEWNIENDACLLRTVQPLEGHHIKPIELIQADFTYPPDTRAVVSGWGLTSVPGSLPEILQMVDVPKIYLGECRTMWPSGFVTDDMLCASEPGRTSCNGDSGGPLVVGGRQIGIVSWGQAGCAAVLPTVFARVAHSRIRGFITEHTGV